MKTKLFIPFLIVLLAAFSNACQKWDPVTEDPGQKDINLEQSAPSALSELNISDHFDWRTTKTLEVNIELPAQNNLKSLKIQSLDGTLTFFKGYPETQSNTLKTKVTVPTYVNAVKLVYGNGAEFPPIEVPVDETYLSYVYPSSLKSLKTVECGECDGGMTSLTLKLLTDIQDATIQVYTKKIESENLLRTFNNISQNEQFSFTGTGKDNKLGSKIFLVINGDEDGAIEIHTSCSQAIYVGQVWGSTFEIIEGTSKDGGPLCSGTSDPDCGECDGKMTSLTLKYLGPDGVDLRLYKDEVKADKYIRTFSNLHTNDIIVVDDDIHDGTLGTKIRFALNDHDHDYTEIHTSCSQPIEVGDIYSTRETDAETFLLLAGVSKDGGNLCGTVDDDDDDDDDDGGSFLGTLAFEDLWPGKGDYDINDLVVEYNFDINKDHDEKIKDITATFTIRAFGADLHNGFGFSFPNVDPSDIISVSGYDIQSGSIYSIAGNGVENGQSKATFIVFDDPFNLMQHPGSGIGVNTDHPAPYVDPVTITLFIDFDDNAVTYSQLDIGNFNPFIIVNQIRGMEVHLPDYPPTDLHNATYFGTFEDDTNPATGRYYKSLDNLFWAINIPERFDYPNEKQVITGAYYKFAAWAQSDGVLFPDWYKDLPGYRNPGAIY